ncbi:hypothetical protein OJF2_00420 [Aquisphaera giovannonii]|uniref:Uncharacterized protein n=1 Tax=Aquisphaera giovannonii TaxID=406548 RepID=A0A5B9VUM7_9BACT|nr:hypothetical protein [Aquisphaera giovannonii]QEH31577.1 hypothetical protein OJF2_00420 [Aquisphaera giovannonii]
MPPEDLEISRDSALVHAVSFLTIVQRSLQAVPPGVEDLFVGDLADEPTLIFDLNESPLFYDFPVALNGRPLGSVRVAATKELGHPWIAIQQALPFDTAASLQRAQALLDQEAAGSQIIEAKPVCHLYPNVGLLLRAATPGGRTVVRLFDPENPSRPLTEIPEGAPPPTGSEAEGPGPYSLLESLSEGTDPRPEFDRFDGLIERLIDEGSDSSTSSSPTDRPRRSIEDIKNALIWNAANQAEMLTRPAGRRAEGEASDQPEGQETERVLAVGHVRQEGQVFCVLACIRMIADSLQVGTLPGQQEMAATLQALAPPLFIPNEGILPSRQVEVFEHFFPLGFEVIFDDTPTWQEFVGEIDAGRAFKSGITRHARVAVGYQVTPVRPTQGESGILQRSLWINDPSRSAVMLEAHEVVTLDPNDPSVTLSVTPRVPRKNNSIFVRPSGP